MKRKSRLVRWLLLAGVPLVLAIVALAYFRFRSAHREPGATLFIIQRNLNSNEVHYDVKVGADGKLAREPVVAYWIMKAEGGRREDLTFLEEKLAYGFEISGSGDEREMKLVAWEDRKIKLTKAKDRWRAFTQIDGKDAVLTRLFIQSEEGGATPKVLFVDVFGEAVDGGKEVREHVVKK